MVFSARRASVLLAWFAVLAFGVFSLRGEAPTTAPASDPKIADALRKLSDGNFRVREEATRTLWAAGKGAAPALREALNNADPESTRRIRSILSNISFGITPDMSADVIEMMSRYRTGDAAAKWQATNALAERGAVGGRVLLKFRTEERDAGVRSMVSRVLSENARPLAASLIGDGDTAAAGQLLDLATQIPATEDVREQNAMDYAAFLSITGKLDEQIAAAKAKLDQAKADKAAPKAEGGGELDEASAAALLAFFHRANGDLAAARDAAAKSGFEPLQHNLLIEAGDWKELARQADADIARADTSALCFATAFHRLAGDDAAVNKLTAMLDAAADRDPDESWNLAEGLLLNGRLDLGMDVMIRHNHFATAVEFQSQRLAFDEIPRLVERAQASGSRELPQVEIKAARARWFAGEDEGAIAAIDAAVKTCERQRDFDGLLAAVDAAADMDQKERLHWYTVAAMQLAVARGRVAIPGVMDAPVMLNALFEKARFKDPAQATGWAELIRQRSPRQPAGKTLELLRSIDEKRIPGATLQGLCDDAATFAKGRPPEQRDAQLELIADTLAAAGRREAATARYTELIRIAAESSPTRVANALSKLAAFDVEAKRWKAAAEGYLQAWSRNQNDPLPLYLSGWALTQAGEASTGNERMDRAHLLPLSDENRRYALYEAMMQRKLVDHAKREREMILSTGGFLSWRRSEALRRAGDDAYAAGDALKAADLWERAFLDNNSKGTRFVEPWANVSMPALIRRTRAVGLIREGQVEAGLKEADVCLTLSPADADSLIEIVSTLDSKGNKAEADALYGRIAKRYAALCEAHPNSGQLHNLYAWAAAKCRRELDVALTHARRAVELQPTNTASLDTLAETHFQRGEFETAILAMTKCAELEPDEPRHKQQLERFRAAMKK